MKVYFLVPVLVVLLSLSLVIAQSDSDGYAYDHTSDSGHSGVTTDSPASEFYDFSDDSGNQYKVIRIVDGDTVVVCAVDEEDICQGSQITVRIHKIDTPEKGTRSKNKPNYFKGITDVECLDRYGQKATNFATQELLDQYVDLVYDSANANREYEDRNGVKYKSPHKDKYGRTLANIIKDGKDYSELILREGLAKVFVDEPIANSNHYLGLEETARNTPIGLWAECGSGISTTEISPEDLKSESQGEVLVAVGGGEQNPEEECYNLDEDLITYRQPVYKGTIDKTGEIFTDSCDGDILEEGTCEGNTAKKQKYDCSAIGEDWKCQDGACVKTEPPEDKETSYDIQDIIDPVEQSLAEPVEAKSVLGSIFLFVLGDFGIGILNPFALLGLSPEPLPEQPSCQLENPTKIRFLSIVDQGSRVYGLYVYWSDTQGCIFIDSNDDNIDKFNLVRYKKAGEKAIDILRGEEEIEIKYGEKPREIRDKLITGHATIFRDNIEGVRFYDETTTRTYTQSEDGVSISKTEKETRKIATMNVNNISYSAEATTVLNSDVDVTDTFEVVSKNEFIIGIDKDKSTWITALIGDLVRVAVNPRSK